MTAAQVVTRPTPVKSAICRNTVTEEKASGAKQASVVTSAQASGRRIMRTSSAAQAW